MSVAVITEALCPGTVRTALLLLAHWGPVTGPGQWAVSRSDVHPHGPEHLCLGTELSTMIANMWDVAALPNWLPTQPQTGTEHKQEVNIYSYKSQRI